MRVWLLMLAVTIAGCGSAQTGSGRVDPVLASLVPLDTFLLVGIRMSEVRVTPLYRKIIAGNLDSTLEDLAKNTNFDIRKDVNDLLIAFTSGGSGKLLLARGNFKIHTPPGFKKATYKGVAVYSKEQGAYAILDPTTTAAAGTERDVLKAIDQKQKAPSGLIPWAGSLPGSGQLWMVSNGCGTLARDLSRQEGNVSNLGRFLQSIEHATATADLRSGLVANVTGECKNEQDAKSLADAARGMIGLGRLNVPENRSELMRVFDGIKVEQKQRSIQVNANIAADLLDKMLQQNPKAGPRAPRSR